LFEIVAPGVDGILCCKAFMPPADKFNDMRAMDIASNSPKHLLNPDSV
jgi:hypothetical protein